MAEELAPEFVQRILSDSQIPDPQGLLDAICAGEPVVAIRHNRLKGMAPATGADLVPWCPTGEYLAERPSFTLDPAFHQGLYYVQDPSSMAIDAVIRSLGLTEPVRYLDACAAPGGKTTAAIDALPEGSFVLANEFEPARAAALCENLMKWGYGKCAVSLGPAQRLAALTPGSFDVIAADVPCSGEGMMRKDAQARRQWTPRLVESCASLQREIVEALWPLLRPGGTLIYSTCTFARAENENNVAHFVETLGAEQLPLPELPGVVGGHFYPHLVRGEGLFMALLRKPGNEPAAPLRRLPSRLLQQGVGPLTEAKGRNEIPTHAACLAADFDMEKWPTEEVGREQAVEFLRRNAIRLSDEAPRGLVLLTYNRRPLGWVNNLGTRANNLLPKSLRILK
ncbi:MAG: hypothetical protein K2N10_00540 [Muribaculaceae bacterium]|nr:hypothetical protein [Muribaculaceae bacterium]